MTLQEEDKIAYVEFGSGRGQLTYWLARATELSLRLNSDNETRRKKCGKDPKFVLIDKASHRFKFDNKLKDETPQLDVTRIRVDIQDLVLKNISDLKDRVSIYDNL